jgi:hypothetical protein
MGTTQIGKWEFTREPERLTYRLTTTGMLSGILLMALLGAFFLIWSYQTLRAASGPGSYLGGGVLALVTLACWYGLFHHVRSRSHPYVLDKGTDTFSNGYKTRCALSQVCRVEVVPIRNHNNPTSYHVDFVLKNGETTSSYLVCSAQGMAEQLARPLQQFLDEIQNS